MADNLDALLKAKKRELDAIDREKVAINARKQKAARRRKVELAISLARMRFIGTAICSTKLSENERLLVAQIVMRSEDKPDGWEGLVDFLKPLPAPVADGLPDFVPSRKPAGPKPEPKMEDAAE